jgi:hypothetical protein
LRAPGFPQREYIRNDRPEQPGSDEFQDSPDCVAFQTLFPEQIAENHTTSENRI